MDRRGLLFDMDGLLLDTERVSMETFVALLPDVPRGEAEAFFMTLVGSSSSTTRELISRRFPDLDLVVFRKDWEAAFLEAIDDEVPVKAGVAETIAGLNAAGHIMAVVTSTETHHARMELERAGLLEAFVDVVGGDAVAKTKPDPEPYLTGARLIGCAPEACLAFEDSDRGTEAAVRAGCTVWQIPDLRAPDVPLPALGQRIARTLPEAVRDAGLL